MTIEEVGNAGAWCSVGKNGTKSGRHITMVGCITIPERPMDNGYHDENLHCPCAFRHILESDRIELAC